MDAFLILVINTAAPGKQFGFWLLEDEDENSVQFNSHDDAKIWIDNNARDPFCYAIIDASEQDLYFA